MRILIINNTSIVSKNGSLFVFRSDEVSSYLKDKGHEVEFFQFRNDIDSGIHTFNLIENGFKVSTIKFFRPKILGYLIAYLKGIWRVLFNDFVYIYYPNNFKLLGLFTKFLGKEYGLYLRGCVGVDAKFSRFLYKHAKVVFCVSPVFTKLVNDSGGRGVDKKPTIPFSFEDIVRNREYTLKDKYNILFLGRADKDKGLFELIDAIKHLNTIHNNFRVDIVGDGNALKGLKVRAKENNIEDVVTFHGAVMDKDTIKRFYLEADVYIFPTYHEGFARTLCEAMIFGTPIITTFVGGIPGFMKENFNALRIEPRSIESIVEKVVFAIENYHTMSAMAKNGTKSASKILYPGRPSHPEQLYSILEE